MGKISMPQILDRYVYCMNNPLRFTDPTGEWFGISMKTFAKALIITALVVASAALTVGTFGTGAPLAAIMLSQGALCGAASFGTTYIDTGDLGAAGCAGLTGFIFGACTAGLLWCAEPAAVVADADFMACFATAEGGLSGGFAYLGDRLATIYSGFIHPSVSINYARRGCGSQSIQSDASSYLNGMGRSHHYSIPFIKQALQQEWDSEHSYIVGGARVSVKHHSPYYDVST